MSDPWTYENSFDYEFADPEEAQDFLEEYFMEGLQEELPNWILVKVTYEPVSQVQPVEELPDDV